MLAANDGLTVPGLVNQEFARSLVSGSQQRGREGDAVDADRRRYAGKVAEGRQQIGDVHDPAAVGPRLEVSSRP